MLLAAVGFGLLAFLGPVVGRTPRPRLDALLALAAVTLAAAALLFFNVARGKGARLLWAAQAQVVALAAVALGAILRLKGARKRRT